MSSDTLNPEALAHEYRLARLRITELFDGFLDDDGRDIGTVMVPSCPAWSVRDLLSHVSGIAAEIVSGNPPSGNSDEWVDAIVASRRHLSPAQLLDDWNVYGPKFEALAAGNKRLAVPLSYDTVVHEHDLRHAINRPGSRDTSGVTSAMHVAVWLMTNDLKRNDFGTVRFRAGGRDWIAGEGPERLSLDVDAEGARFPIWELVRLTGSRRSKRQMSVMRWNGDLEVALGSLLHMDLPAADIVE
jgi:uncharacterized protein (TIGR03083 family)